MAEDYYSILGVPRTATADDIKRAYRRLAHKHHPDKAGGNEEKFKQINAAYQVLSDQQKRSQYDQFGQSFEPGQGNPFSGGGSDIPWQDFSGFADIFNEFFGGRSEGGRGQGRGTRRRVHRGQDVAIDLTISFVESARGGEYNVSHRLYQTCQHCRGSGAEPGTAIVDCPTCGGRGQVTSSQQTVFGVFAQTVPCPSCEGTGKKPEKPCKQCNGQGRERFNRTLKVTVPAGIADGQIIRLSGKGEAPPYGGINGDLFITIHVKTDRSLRREGDNVHSKAKISFIDAALGTTIPVTTLEGSQELTIPAGTQPATTFTLSKHGFPHLGGAGRGDHIVTVEVEIPRRLSRQQKKILEQFKTAKKKFLF